MGVFTCCPSRSHASLNSSIEMRPGRLPDPSLSIILKMVSKLSLFRYKDSRKDGPF
ncbi:unnamed protein product [Ixodes pacificus]